jgi:CRISPR-associated protein Cas1
MRKLLNILYVTTPDAYLSLDGENIVVLKDDERLMRVPLHNLEGIVTYGYTGASPALLGACAKRGIAVSFCTANGRFLASMIGETQGNVVLRRTQYRAADNEKQSMDIARNILIGKFHNSRWVLERSTRDHADRLNVESIKLAGRQIMELVQGIQEAETYGELLGIEGNAANRYFSVFDELILQNKDAFFFKERSRRPPLDNVNALLSFIYTMLAHDTAAALTAVGLDPFVGFLHKDRPGRRSLALDLMEELRAPLADRFVLTMINTRQINADDFEQRENGAVIMRDHARKAILAAWQTRKQSQIEHPFLKEKIEWGLVPHTQALLMARYFRGDLDAYPPFLWK